MLSSGVILLGRPRDGIEHNNGYGRKYRALFTKLSMPAFPGEQGGENGVADQRGAG